MLRNCSSRSRGSRGSPAACSRRNAGEYRLQDRPRLLRRDPGPQPAPDPKPSGIGVRDRALVPHHRGRPEIGHDPRLDTREAFLRHPDDLKRLLADGDPATEDAPVAAESPPPEVMAQHGDRVLAGMHVIRWRQQPAQGRLHAESASASPEIHCP